MRITILTNGPGELWDWVRPVVSELRRRGHTISLWILPCQFASGHEREAASLLGVDKLEGPASTASIWENIAHEKTDAIIQLGGDVAFGLRMAEFSRVPLTVYSYGHRKNIKGVKLLTAYEAQAQSTNATPIGDLVKDALALDVATSSYNSWNWPRIEGSPRVLFLPGSRPAIRKHALGWLADVHSSLKARMPDIRVRSLFSQFMPQDEFIQWQKAGLNPFRAGAALAMKNADFALTQPGTNNFELMHCGLPGLVVAPEKFLRFVPVSGVLGILANIPLIGIYLRRIGANRIIKRWGCISLPNRISIRKVMHEMYGDVTPEDAAEEICERLNDKEGLKNSRQELLKLSGPAGAASKICDIVTSR